MSGVVVLLVGAVLCFLGIGSVHWAILASGFGLGWLLADLFSATVMVSLLVAAGSAVLAWVLATLVFKVASFVVGLVAGALVGARLFAAAGGRGSSVLLAVVVVVAVAVLTGLLADRYRERALLWATALGGAGLVLSGLGLMWPGGLGFLRDPTSGWQQVFTSLIWVALGAFGWVTQRRLFPRKLRLHSEGEQPAPGGHQSPPDRAVGWTERRLDGTAAERNGGRTGRRLDRPPTGRNGRMETARRGCRPRQGQQPPHPGPVPLSNGLALATTSAPSAARRYRRSTSAAAAMVAPVVKTSSTISTASLSGGAERAFHRTRRRRLSARSRASRPTESAARQSVNRQGATPNGRPVAAAAPAAARRAMTVTGSPPRRRALDRRLGAGTSHSGVGSADTRTRSATARPRAWPRRPGRSRRPCSLPARIAARTGSAYRANAQTCGGPGDE